VTGDQWFVVAQGVVGIVAVCAGVLVGSYAYRKGKDQQWKRERDEKHDPDAGQPERTIWDEQR
jgi:hypothetical protein